MDRSAKVKLMPQNAKHSKAQRLILLDLGNVLLNYHPARFSNRASERSPKPAAAIFDRYCVGDIKAEFERGNVAENEFFAEMAGWLEWDKSDMDELKYFWKDCFTFTEGAAGALKELYSKHPLWLFSNTNVTHYNYFSSEFDIMKYFEKVFLSFELGKLKTDKGAFDAVIRESKTGADRILFFDDLEENVRCARDAGIRGFVFRNWKEAMKIISKIEAD